MCVEEGTIFSYRHYSLLNIMESMVLHLIGSPPLTLFYLLNLAALFNFFLSSIAISVLTALLNLLTAFLSTSCGNTALVFFYARPLSIYKLLVQELTSTSVLSSILLVYSGIVLICQCFLISMTCNFPRREYRDTSLTELVELLWICYLTPGVTFEAPSPPFFSWVLLCKKKIIKIKRK